MAELTWRCNPGPQREFLFGKLSTVREIMYGGAKGGGKSAAIGPKALQHVAKYPEYGKVLVLRQDFSQLAELIEMIRPQCLAAGGIWTEQKKTWRFAGGASIRFGHLTDGCEPYWGHSYSLIIVDEITRCIDHEADYLKLLGSLRSGNGVPCQVVVLTNPGGPGHNWVANRFLNVPPMTVQKDHNTGLERVYIPARLSDNPHLGPDYRATLESLPEAEKKAFLNGEWDAFTGQVFNLIPGVHIINWKQFNKIHDLHEDNNQIPQDWLRFRSYDHGYAHPGACYWYAVDYDGRAYIYRELYTVARDFRGEPIPNIGAKLAPQQVAKIIREYSEGEKYAASWTGPDLFYEVRQDMAGGVKLNTHFAAEGIHFTAWNAAEGSRVAGKQALHQRLHFEQDEEGKITQLPGLMILDECAPNLVRTFSTLEYSKQRPELWDKTSEDHAADSVTGFCKMRSWAPVRTAQKVDGWRSRQNVNNLDWMLR